MPDRATVADEMLRTPRVIGAQATAKDLRATFADAHTNSVLVVDGKRLLTMVVRDDLAGVPDGALAADLGTLEGRTAPADGDAEQWRTQMLSDGVRRLAVVGDDRELLGLLCLKRSGTGFCSPGDVSCHATEVEPLREAAGGWLPPAYDAVVLTGGRAERLAGVDKTMLTVGDVSILDRIRQGLFGVHEQIVVGREVGGGPVAALAAALPRLTSDIVVTLAGDMPFIADGVSALLRALVAAPSTVDATVLVADGHRQHLAAAWRTEALRRRIGELADPVGRAARELYGVGVLEVEDTGGWSLDVDTGADLERARAQSLSL